MTNLHAGFAVNQTQGFYENTSHGIVISQERDLRSHCAPHLWRVTCWGHAPVRGFTRLGDALEYGALMCAVIDLPDNTF